MANKTWWVCSSCGYEAPSKFFKCPNCGSFSTAEQKQQTDDKPEAGMKVNTNLKSYVAKTKSYHIQELAHEDIARTVTGISEFDRLLDGGLVQGQVVLIGAEPGFGKSTLALEVLGHLSDAGHHCLYASGEESAYQIAERANRLHIDSEDLIILSTTTVEDVLSHAIQESAEFVVVDSLQTMASEAVDGTIGGISQSRESAITFKQFAKQNNVSFLLISQFTKGDEVAGSNQIAHVVDTIFIGDSDSETRLKFLRSQKNRYGKTDDVAVFVHEEDGLKSVSDPSEYLIGDMNDSMPGSARTFIQNGTRILPVEINALVTDETYATPQRQFSGFNFSRGKILVAACSKYLPVCKINDADAFISTISGVQINDPNADLALVAAIVSSSQAKSPRDKTAWIGEVALTGKIRGRALISSKVKEAERLGFDRVVIPESAYSHVSKDVRSSGITITTIDTLKDIIHLI
jgi:DNA repair protein RadA/Sms